MLLPRALRWVGYALLAVVLATTLRDWDDIGSHDAIPWCVAFAAFAIAFHIGATALEEQRARRLVALGVQTPAMFAMAAILPCHFGALSLVIVASQAALTLSPQATAAWIGAQTLVLGYFLSAICSFDEELSSLIALLGFQGFAAVTVFVARREAAARRMLAHTNAELRATRALLEDASRAQERTRIARELHDVLGHDLTALGLQLEVASHVAPISGERAAEHVEKAQHISARLLHNVRDVVSAMRVTDGAGLRGALATLIEAVPNLTVHLDVARDLRVDDTARAHCVLRCVQEIVTNTLRHAKARNLWISIAQDDGAVAIDARDDGCGAAVVAERCGLSGMRDRIAELGGALRVAPTPSFAIRATLPLEVPS